MKVDVPLKKESKNEITSGYEYYLIAITPRSTSPRLVVPVRVLSMGQKICLKIISIG